MDVWNAWQIFRDACATQLVQAIMADICRQIWADAEHLGPIDLNVCEQNEEHPGHHYHRSGTRGPCKEVLMYRGASSLHVTRAANKPRHKTSITSYGNTQ